MARKPLRAVADDEVPEPAAPAQRLTVAQAAATGDHLALLKAMRERIAQTVSDPQCPSRDLASLTLRLQNIAAEIEAQEMRAREEGSDAADVIDDEDWSAEAL